MDGDQSAAPPPRPSRLSFFAMHWLTIAALAASAALAACARSEPPPLPPPAPVAALPAPSVPDAGTDASVDAQPDAGGPLKHAARKKPAAPAANSGGGFKVDGKLSKADVEKVVRAGMLQLRGCYAAAKATKPDLKGRVLFKLTIDHRGGVTLGEVVTSTLGGGDPEMCMVQATRDFRFPRSDGESTVGFQMAFN
jgi:hypothetical protein